MKKTLGCEEPTQAPAEWLDEDELWFNCPINFINETAMSFLSKYDAYKNHMATPPDVDQQSAAYFEAVLYFESQLSHFVEIKTGK